MPPKRPTFSESWYRVDELRPQLRCTVQTFRQHYRGRLWHVVRDPASNQYFRLNDASYFFVGLLNGKRTVSQAWQIANDQLGDSAPTQPEVIQLLGQLYGANLLVAEIAADSAGLFDRYKKKIRREVTGYLANLLFVRVPLWDPDHTLDRWLLAIGWVFSPVGFVFWLAWMIYAISRLAGHGEDMVSEGLNVLDPNNLIYLYGAMIFTKALHELGHGFACKKFGHKSHCGGEVHTIGIMFLVFMPVPYVDASSAWALRSKWQRAVIGAAGMFVELAIAGGGVLVWLNTDQGEPIHKIAYNTMFIASVSTLLFNGNPLLRFDGYYILSDLLEIPNLSQRSKDYLYFLVKRYIFGATEARHPIASAGERVWLLLYYFASTIYRTVIAVGIILFVFYQLPVPLVGVAMAIVAVTTWVFIPTGKFVRYLATNGELLRCRTRAVAISILFVAALVTGIGVIRMPEHLRAEGVLAPRNMQIVFTREPGILEEVLKGSTDVPEGKQLLVMTNRDLLTRRQQLHAERNMTRIQYRSALDEDQIGGKQAFAVQLETLEGLIKEIDHRLESLTVRAPIAGKWVAKHPEHGLYSHYQAGQQVGIVADVNDLIVHMAADQKVGPRLGKEFSRGKPIQMRLRGRSTHQFTGTLDRISQAAHSQLPSAALGYVGGGTLAVSSEDPEGRQTTEGFWEIVINPDLDPTAGKAPTVTGIPLFSGQRVVARFELPKRPLAAQWWQRLRQMIQSRFES